MGLQKQVKVGNITNLSEARYCAGMGVDYLSFPTSIDPKTFGEITGWISGPKFGIEINDDSISVESYAPDFIVVSINDAKVATTHTLSVKVNAKDLPQHHEQLLLLKNQIIFIELDFEDDPIDTEKSHSVLNQLKEDFQLFVKYRGGDLQQYLSLPIDGISLEGEAEERPGLKEYPLATILEELDSES